LTGDEFYCTIEHMFYSAGDWMRFEAAVFTASMKEDEP
jgi:hypothetical protein